MFSIFIVNEETRNGNGIATTNIPTARETIATTTSVTISSMYWID